jgi:carboxyl-terminal processing protease
MKTDASKSMRPKKSAKTERGFEKDDAGPLFDGGYISYIGIALIVVSVFAVGLIIGKATGSGDEAGGNFTLVGSRDPGEVTELDLGQLWEVWETVKTGHVDDSITDEDLYYGALKGIAGGAGDPVTVFLTPEETEQYNEGNQGVFQGIGAELGYEDGVLVVVAPLEGSPALEAGLRPGDRILAVDDRDVAGENIYQVVSWIRGDAGTKVSLTVVPKGASDPEVVEITRGEITVPSVAFEEIADDIVVIDVDRFTESSVSAWQKRWDDIVIQAIDSGPSGIVLDLRGNPGGYFNAAVWAAGEFLPKGSLVAEQFSRDTKVAEFTISREGKLQDIPLVVLVDQLSASASEILAGALAYHGRAYIIGEPTYGKGTAQQVIDYPDGSSLHITTLKWVLPDGSHLDHENVIQPDKEVELTSDDFKQGDDPQLDAARGYLNSK